MTAKHGGFRKGAGRPKGSRNRATIAREARQSEALAAARAQNTNLTAIDYLLEAIRDPMTPPGRRAKIAMFVAPYLEYRMRLSRARRQQPKPSARSELEIGRRLAFVLELIARGEVKAKMPKAVRRLVARALATRSEPIANDRRR